MIRFLCIKSSGCRPYHYHFIIGNPKSWELQILEKFLAELREWANSPHVIFYINRVLYFWYIIFPRLKFIPCYDEPCPFGKKIAVVGDRYKEKVWFMTYSKDNSERTVNGKGRPKFKREPERNKDLPIKKDSKVVVYRPNGEKVELSSSRANYAKEIIARGKAPTVENIQQVLKDVIFTHLITQRVLNLCQSIFEKGLRVPVPFPYSENSKKFSKIIGPGNKKDDNRKRGCYLIQSRDGAQKYVGQSSNISGRIRTHAGKLGDNSSRVIFRNHGQNVLITVFVVDKKDIDMPIGDFLVILEQFLFFSIRPNVNKTAIASNASKFKPIGSSKLSKPIYVYICFQGKFYLIHTSHGRTHLSKAFGIGEGFCADIVRTKQGWYQNVLYFTFSALEDSIDIKIDELTMVEFFQFVQYEDTRQAKSVLMKDTETDHIRIYSRISSFVKVNKSWHYGCVECIEEKKLFRKKFLLSYMDPKTYTFIKLAIVNQELSQKIRIPKP